MPALQRNTYRATGHKIEWEPQYLQLQDTRDNWLLDKVCSNKAVRRYFLSCPLE